MWKGKTVLKNITVICDFRRDSGLNQIFLSGNQYRFVCHVCVAAFFLEICNFTPMTVPSYSCWLQPPLVLLGIHSLESEMCLHFEHVTNYLLRLTLRDLAEAFTLLRCCLGQSYFRGWLCQFDCLYLTGFSKPDVNPGKR